MQSRHPGLNKPIPTKRPNGNSHQRRVEYRLRERLGHHCNAVLGWDAKGQCLWCGKEKSDA